MVEWTRITGSCSQPNTGNAGRYKKQQVWHWNGLQGADSSPAPSEESGSSSSFAAEEQASSWQQELPMLLPAKTTEGRIDSSRVRMAKKTASRFTAANVSEDPGNWELGIENDELGMMSYECWIMNAERYGAKSNTKWYSGDKMQSFGTPWVDERSWQRVGNLSLY